MYEYFKELCRKGGGDGGCDHKLNVLLLFAELCLFDSLRRSLGDDPR